MQAAFDVAPYSPYGRQSTASYPAIDTDSSYPGSPMLSAGDGSGPVYGPSITTTFQQFVDVHSGSASNQPDVLPSGPYVLDPAVYYGGGSALPTSQPRSAAPAAVLAPSMPLWYTQAAMKQSAVLGNAMQDFTRPLPSLTVGYPHDVTGLPTEITCPCIHCQAAQVQLAAMTPQRPNNNDSTFHPSQSPDEYFTATPGPTSASATPQTGARSAQRNAHVIEESTPRRRPNRENGHSVGSASANRSESGWNRRERDSAQPQPPAQGGRSGKNSRNTNNRTPQSGSRGSRAAQETSPSPVAALSSPSSTRREVYATVLRGHHGRKFSVVSHVPLAPGDFVIFEGDRGEDLGKVLSIETTTHAAANSALVTRPATADEQHHWAGAQATEAAEAIDVCNRAVETLGLPLRVTHAAFQFDHNKLTFFYESEDRVDFRRLLSEMFGKFRCRIWMERVDVLDLKN